LEAARDARGEIGPALPHRCAVAEELGTTTF
jgi:hypothetical protein